MRRKRIIFILDSFDLYYFEDVAVYCYSYIDTEEAIDNKLEVIWTYDIGHLSFDLETLEYDIFIGYKGKLKQFKTGMSTTNGKELRFGHNLRRLLMGGALDNDLGIKRKRNYYIYDSEKSTHELCEMEMNKQLLANIIDKTIGFELSGVKAMTSEESFEWHKKHSRIDTKTGNLIISDDEIGDGSYEQKYGYKLVK